MFIQLYYSYYEGSKRASLILAYGNLLKWGTYIYALIMLALNYVIFAEEELSLKGKIIVCAVEISFGLLMYITGRIVKASSKVYATSQIEAKAIKSFEFAKNYVKLKPDSKEWMMELNDDYYEYVRSGREEMDKRFNRETNPEKGNLKYALMGCLVIVAIFVSLILFIKW